MCGRVCSLSRVKGGVECCGVCHEKIVRWCGGGGACWLPVWAWVASRFLRAGGYWRVVGEGLFPSPPFFVAAGVHLWAAGKRKVAAWGECLVSSFA